MFVERTKYRFKQPLFGIIMSFRGKHTRRRLSIHLGWWGWVFFSGKRGVI